MIGSPFKMLFVFVALICALNFQAFANDGPSVPQAEKEWTFLLFLNGHNNLDSYGDLNVNQMEEVGSNDQLNMVVQWASLQNGPTKRLYITKDSDTNQVNSPVVESMDPVDMGDYKQLVEFVRWGIQKYPAKHYMIAVWNHGNGWHPMQGFELKPQDISYDDLTNNKITSEQLGIAMAEIAKTLGRKVDIYASDACLMAMGEVAAEMRDSVSYFAGAQETEPGTGWPYNTWMKRWTEDRTPTAPEVLNYLVEEYLKAYSGGIYGTQDVTLSAWDMAHFPAFESAMKNLNSALTSLAPEYLSQLKTAAGETQEFYSSDYKDIVDFVKRFEAQAAGVQTEVMSALKESVRNLVIANGVSDYYANAHGVSVWLPTSSYFLNEHKERYSQLEFNKATGWLDFLEKVNQ